MNNTEKTINIGIIGAGVVAQRIINAANKHQRGNVKGIYDVDSGKLHEIT